MAVETLSDIAKRLGKDAKEARIIDILAQENQILDDMVFREANQGYSELMVVQTELPTPVIRRYNQGVTPTKGSTAQLVETCVNFEDRSSLDVDLANRTGNIPQARLSRGRMHIEGFNQKMAQQLIYGASSEEMLGLANRYALSTDTNGDNIIKAGGSGSDNTSIYLIGWGEDKCYGIYPKGVSAGITHEDLGIGDELDSSSKPYRAHRDRWKWEIGLCVPDHRYVVRICNIDKSDLVAESSAADLIKLMAKAIDRIPGTPSKLAFYANRTVLSMLRIQALNKSSNALSVEDAINQFGVQRPGGQVKFLGIPVKRVDQIHNAEATVA